MENPKRQPRNVVFRENARLRSPGLFSGIEEEEPLSGAPHFLIVHGHQELNFAHFGAPSATSKTKWAWLSRNLMSLPHEMPAEGPNTENTDVDLDELQLLKEDIERWRRDNGEQ